MKKCNGWRRSCSNEANWGYTCPARHEERHLCESCYHAREDEREDFDAQSREHSRQLREYFATLPASEINPETGLPVEFSDV